MWRALLILGLAARALFGQAGPQFEAASVKASAGSGTDIRGGPGTADPGLFTCHNFPLSALIARAYDLQSYQLAGPAWLDQARFDVTARVPAGAMAEQFRLMLQDLLARRFHLATHEERREMRVWELTVGAGGAKLKERGEAGESGIGGSADGGVTRRMAGWPVATMAAWFQTVVREPVLDETGLTGRYDATLHYFPEGDASGPDFFQAIERQLGLKLTRVRREMAVRVVDRVERAPVEN